jgi:hypothetical protein
MVAGPAVWGGVAAGAAVGMTFCKFSSTAMRAARRPGSFNVSMSCCVSAELRAAVGAPVSAAKAGAETVQEAAT